EKIPLDKIAGFPSYQRWIVICVIQILIFTGYYFLSYSGKTEEIAKLNGELSALQQEIAKNEKVAKRLPVLEKEIEKLDVDLSVAKTQLPEEKEIPSLLTNISNLAMQSGLDILTFKPGGESPKDFYAEVPVQIKINGSFHNTLEFFDKVSKMPRIVTISNIKIGGVKEEKGRTVADMECSATTFRYIEKTSVEKAPEKKVEKK
ncbi:MAG: type 4a pilus biogenesis protein PilO, partial [Nitrospinae bacterium]|nr:type 4a pilus biogenesis protein PilO [Nitrospinota bacterium]